MSSELELKIYSRSITEIRSLYDAIDQAASTEIVNEQCPWGAEELS